MSHTEAKTVNNYVLWRNQYHEISTKKDLKNSFKKPRKQRDLEDLNIKQVTESKEKFDREHSQKMEYRGIYCY